MQLLQLFQWTQIDWVKWMPVEIFVLLFLIVLVRLIRRATRWGSVKTSHVMERLWNYNGNDYTIYFQMDPTKNLDDNMKIAQNKKRILLVPPLSYKKRKGYHLATAIAMLGIEVVILTPRDIQNFCMNNQDLKNNFSQFLSTLNISNAILFDYSIFPVFSKLGLFNNQQIEKDLLKISWVLIRPIMDWRNINSLWSFIPFTSIWFSRWQFLRFRKKFELNCSQILKENIPEFDTPKNNDNNEKDENNYNDEKKEINAKLELFFIQPSKTWLSLEGQEKLEQWQRERFKIPEKKIIQFSEGNWTFFRNETIVLGFIIQQILKIF